MIPSSICADCAVRDRALCASLSDEELLELNALGQRRHLSRGEALFWAGDDSAICANLLDGVLKIVASTSDGREQIVGLLYPADFAGQLFAAQVDFTIAALTDVDLCVFPRGAFEKVLQRHARMEHLLLQRTLAALGEARSRMLSLARKSAEEKVAGFLIDMTVRMADASSRATPGGPVTFDLPLSRGQMADILGLTIETVSRQITKLRDAGVINLPGGRAITIADRPALIRRAEAA
ncbi:MAG: Crp/Fnr family transcriptional regulator [Pseudomonadota bacterium]|nr:Crp/Fnr family transcriptional regulator [Sphingobium sp.]MCC4252098.1 Crp/Fnr family transcriptional regulator [Sphingobium naphthae]MEC8034716.1 Crp/Fnr family transcriptional regulator [Pseudomonadota bacterium]|tara:strand:+ start:135 stop:845 length:711 start_codon:yes stop_codon:yes gene_type:complete